MNELRQYIRILIESFAEIKSSDVVTVYHGTRLSQVFDFINGFDANTIRYRHYGGPRHVGLFVTGDFKTAYRFADRGEIVLEIDVRAKNLHGTDWSGNIGRHQRLSQDHSDWLRDKYPDSFRPYLSDTLLSKGEPQALLRGLVRPSQIKRIWYQPIGEESGRWYSRNEFVSLGIEAIPGKDLPYGRKQPLRDLEFDLSYPNYSVEEFVVLTSKIVGVNTTRVEDALMRWAKMGFDTLAKRIEEFGFGPTAAKSFTRKFIRHYDVELHPRDYKHMRD
jgi:hypothetical protein